ncbi:zinc finger protein 485-like, partial [Ostrinia furnacalis]|uniref:zinc finger protein 485-like n=1 Tax=Ostrinia furnacalis TaxID=93504 RepID=UPI00103F7F8B
MNLEFISTSIKPICEGCLSVDRKLSPVFDVEIRAFFKELVDPLTCYSDVDHLNHPSALCWECTAIIKRTLNYKKQVQHAHGLLIQYMLHHTTNPPVLSSLSICSNRPENIDPADQKNIITNVRPTSPSKNTSAVTKKSRAIEQQLTSSVEPLEFLKVEQKDDETEFDDLEGYYVENDDTNDDYDKDLEAILKSTTDQESKTNVTSKGRTSDVDEFGESDEEPLKKRTEAEDTDAKKYKPRGKRKKKNKTEDSKPKKAKGKREKPAGVVEHPRVLRKLEQLNVPRGRVQMVVLSWEEVEQERQKALQSESFTRHEYRCASCALGFNHRFKLLNHMKKHEPSAGALACHACGTRCRDAHALTAHKRRHRVRWRCTVCGELSSRAAVAADHHARAHGSQTPTHTCSLCGHTAPTLGKLRNHMKNHSERPKCDLCGKTFRDKASLRTHLFIHGGEKEYACGRCGKRFLFKKAMQLHLVTHDAPAHLYCHQCDVTFKNRMTYYQHMKYNLKHIDPAKLKHACATCGKKFTKAARLEEHNVAVHLKTTPVSCTMPDCSFACSSRTVLRTHIRMVHRNLRAARNHVCHACGKAYKTKTSLEGHLRAHSGERPFACALCSSTFAYEAALYNHNKLVHQKGKVCWTF